MHVFADQLKILVRKDFKVKYDSTALGVLWSVSTPILMSVVYYFVFGRLLRLGTRDFALYLVSGNFLWHYFSGVVMQSGSVLLTNSTLLKKTAVDRRLFILSTFITETIHFLITIPILFVLMFVYDKRLEPVSFLANVSVTLLSIAFMAIGIGYVFSILNLFFRDLQRIMSIVMMIWLYCSPVFIPLSRVPEQYYWIYNVNPMARILCTWRDAFYSPSFHPTTFAVTLGVTFLVFVIGSLIFRVLEPRAAEMM